MTQQYISPSYGARLSKKTFKKFAQFIEAELGIKMPPTKHTLVQSRLFKRLSKLRLDNFEAYYEYVTSISGPNPELVEMINAITTNHTKFFREPKHFTYLERTVLPVLLKKKIGVQKPLKVWSAGCSSGEEPYTLAIVLSEFEERKSFFKFSIVASDISTSVVDKGRAGIYTEEDVEEIPLWQKKKYLLKSMHNNKVRIVSQLRKLVTFRMHNLLNEPVWSDGFDIIFCRNVMIYFDNDVRNKVVNHFASILNPGGYLFIGHSETLNSCSAKLRKVAPTVYCKS